MSLHPIHALAGRKHVCQVTISSCGETTPATSVRGALNVPGTTLAWRPWSHIAWSNAQQLKLFCSPEQGGHMQSAHGQWPVLAPKLCLGIVQESTSWPEPKVGQGPFQWFDTNKHFAGIIQPATGTILCQSLSESFR